MEKCYFNSCPLNDADLLKTYKKGNLTIKYILYKNHKCVCSDKLQ